MIFYDISQVHNDDSDHMPILSEWNLQVWEKSKASWLHFK